MIRVGPEHLAQAALFFGALGLALVLDEGALGVYVQVALAAIVTVGVSLLMGYAGQVSLGQGAFYAIGAYTAGVLATSGFPSFLGLLAAPLVAAVVAAVVGTPLLLLRGHHLAFATLAVHIISLSLFGELSLTGGDVGLQGVPRLRVLAFELDSVRSYAVLSCVLLSGVVVMTRNILVSRPGRALRALSSSEVAAASCGIPVGRYKLAVFALSAAIAGLAGGVYAFYMGYLAPGSFPILLSIEYVVMASVGGLGSVAGALIGSVAVFLLVHGLSRLATMGGMPSTAPVILSYAVYASLLIVAVLFMPHGLSGMLEARWRRWSSARRPPAPITSGSTSTPAPDEATLRHPRSVP